MPSICAPPWTSILSQDFGDFELIINDNASQDATPDISREYERADARVRYVPNPRNLGAAPNYNRGFELSRGQYLKWCAHDDLISPNFVGACLAALERDPGASLAFGRTQCIDTDGNEIDGEDNDQMGSILDADPAHRFRKAITMSGTCFPIFGLFRKQALSRSTLHRLYYGSDRALIAETALLGRCLMVPEAIFYNREHQSRSIRIVDHAERSKWQNTSSSRSASMEHVGYLRHLVEIATRHPDTVSRSAALMPVAAHALQPMHIAQVALDLARYASPATANWLRRALVGAPAGTASPPGKAN